MYGTSRPRGDNKNAKTFKKQKQKRKEKRKFIFIFFYFHFHFVFVLLFLVFVFKFYYGTSRPSCRCLRGAIYEIDSKNERFLLSASVRAKFGLVFVLTLQNAFC